jgi:DNA polymerase-3 subunit alpha
MTKMQLLRLANEFRISYNATRQSKRKELKVIDELSLVVIFLINWDIHSNSMGFMHIGRGSGLYGISYCLWYSERLAPLRLDLYFEPFF